VDGAGDQLLARAAFARDQHVRPVARDAFDHLEHAPDGERLADDLGGGLIPVELFTQRPVLGLQAARLNRTLEDEDDLVRVAWLDDIIIGANLHGLDSTLDRAVARQDDDRNLRVVGFQLPQERHPVHLRHLEVGHNGVEGKLRNPAGCVIRVGGNGQRDLPERVLAILCQHHVVTVPL
jgi:hypothetical protein